MSENDQSTTEDQPLTPKQDMVIELLLAGVNITGAAKQAGIAEKTARRWLKLPHFQQAYRIAQHSLFDQALTGLMNKVDKAINTLDRNMTSEDAPASTQVRAAQITIEQSISIYKTQQLEERISELERILGERIR